MVLNTNCEGLANREGTLTVTQITEDKPIVENKLMKYGRAQVKEL